MTTTPKLVIFTDLDGTLLDRDSYSFEHALPALRAIREKRIPLVFSSSKTRSEIEFYRKKMENDHPFISENGGAVFIPEDYFSFPFSWDRASGDQFVLELGTRYPQIVAVLDSIRKETGVPIKGFSDLTVEEISFLCGLSLQEAGFAKEREYDEPFLIGGGEQEVEMVRKKILEKGMNYVWGGRFHHILGNNDKGRAVGILKHLFEKEFHSISSVGIGDSQNDLPMLLSVDTPIFLRENQTALPETVLPIEHLTVVDGRGSRVWNRVILNFLN
ncbi:MAG TPA: mannosyl-3-phosphoglycerate phosphatase [Thermodesulfobacteriota bacterium]|nr:mannosyl-3-phosphoglycerate phosphatase [Thermodesulfobacteriota bacterium]